MPALAVTKTYANGNVLTETDLDNIRTSIQTFFNTTKIDGDNVQTGWITTSYLSATAGIVGTQIANATIATGNLQDDCVTAAKLADDLVLPGNPASAGTFALATTGCKLVSGGAGQLHLTATSNAGIKVSSSARSLDVITGSGSQVYGMVTGPYTTHAPLVIGGYVSSAGAVNNGVGFSASKLGTGSYRVTFTTAFAAIYSVVATPRMLLPSYQIDVSAIGTSSFDIATSSNDGTATDAAFTFVAIGERGA